MYYNRPSLHLCTTGLASTHSGLASTCVMEYAGTTVLPAEWTDAAVWTDAVRKITTAQSTREIIRATRNALYVLRTRLETTNSYIPQLRHDELLRDILANARLTKWPPQTLNGTTRCLHADLEYLGGRVLEVKAPVTTHIT